MSLPRPIAGKGTTLFYAGRCPKCRILSAIVVVASLNTIRRVPIESDEARQMYQRYPETYQKLVVFHELLGQEGLAVGPWAYVTIPLLIVKTWTVMARLLLRRLATAVVPR